MRGEAQTLNTVTLELPANLVEQLSEHADTVGISIDAEVRASQTIEHALPQRGEPVTGKQLRATLGVKPTDGGRGVGVAIIDSGIAPTGDLAGRISAFYDFTGDSAPRATTPSDGYGHGTHIAGLIAGSGAASRGKYVGVAKAARLIGLKVLDSHGCRLHERRYRSGRVRDGEQGSARHRRHQHVARSPDLRAGRDRSARPGRRARGASRHRCRGLGRQHRHEPDDRRDWLCGHHVSRAMRRPR